MNGTWSLDGCPGSRQISAQSLFRLNLGSVSASTCRTLFLNPRRGEGGKSRSRTENSFMKQSQIFKVDLFNPFLDIEESIVEEVRVRATKHSRNLVCRGDVAFRGSVWALGRRF